MFKDKKRLYIFLIALLPMLLLSVLPFIGSAKAEDYTLGDINQYVYFDLAAGDVMFNGDHYHGYVFKTDENGDTTQETVDGYISQDGGRQYYIYQSYSSNESGLIYDAETETYQMRLPVYDPVMINGMSWGEYITNNTVPENVQNSWPVRSTERFGRRSTPNRIYVVGATNTYPTFVFDNLWSSYNDSSDGSPSKYPVAFYSQPNNNITVQLKGDNRFSEIWAVSNEEVSIATNANADTINGMRPDTAGQFIVDDYPNQSGTLTLTCPVGDLSNNSSIFGGDDKKRLEINESGSTWTASTSTKDPNYGFSNIYINGGNVYVGVPVKNNSEWSSANVTHGLGSRNLSYITINGGTVTAISNSTAAAIGGGGGFGSPGGIGCVEINNGNVYAYNNSIYGTSSYNVFVPSTAIGSGSCVKENSATGVVRINGGNVYAQSVGGLAIGGGSSGIKNGGTGYVDITGGNITAVSVSGSIRSHSTDAGVAIGGGVSGNRTGNDGGDAYINIYGGTIISGSVGGGNTRDTIPSADPGRNGFAAINITNGNIQAQFVMEGGGSKNCTFTMSGGTIHDVDVSAGNSYVYPNGGAVWMQDPHGISTISGGSIDNCTALQGGAVYMTGGTFSMTDGSITNCRALGPNGNDGYGGAVYIENSTGDNVEFTLTDGLISDNNAAFGGGVCVNGGTITMSGGAMERNTAELGGAINLNEGAFVMNNGSITTCSALQGGAIYMTGGTYTMNDGSITSCTAGNSEIPGNGGAVHIKGDAGENVVFTINGGEISGSSATNDGGGIYLENATVNVLGGSIVSNTASDNGGGICVNEGTITMYGGSVANNNATAGSGGGLYVSANNNPTLIDFLSGSFSGNIANQNGGGIAVESATNQSISFIMGINVVHTGAGLPYDSYNLGPGHDGHTNHIGGLVHESCPLVNGNTAINGNGGGFYLNHVVSNGGTDNERVNLQIYCLQELDNHASNPDSNGMFMQGGIVEIFGDEGYAGVGDPACNVNIGSTILVEGGQVSVYGTMDNPHFDAPITVNIIDPDHDFFHDRRYNNSANHRYFSVSYFENDDGGLGNYRQIQYEMLDGEDDFVIAENIYMHEGYQLLCWNTEPDGTGYTFDVGAGYNYLDNPDAWKEDSETGDRKTLTLYAIWEKIIYYINFESNPPAGVPCSGEMETQSVEIIGVNRLNPNAYSIPNYRFRGWSLNREGSGTRYPDEWTINPPFTQVLYDEVTLYAQWEICPHERCELTADNNVITQTCLDCGHIGTASITADDAYYDGREHPARVIYSDEWAGAHNLVVTYTLAADSSWDSVDDIDDNFTPSTVPVHAGSYTASIIVDSENSISCSYVIHRIKWPSAPTSPEITLNDDYSVTVTSTSEDGGSIEYCMAERSSDPSNWSSNNRFEGLIPGHYYIFFARNAADRDHIESESNRSEVYLYDGNNTIVFHPDAGLVITPEENIIDFIVSLEEGYHYYHYDIAVTVNDERRDDVYCTTNPLADLSYSHSIVIPSEVTGSRIDIYITGAVKDCTVDSYVTPNEVFTPFTNDSATISSDSAFTARFVVNDYRFEDYSNQRFVFGSQLPVGTTLILTKSDGSYWYYNVLSQTSEIALSSFRSMGRHTGGASSTDENFSYQLIVDFSDVAKGSRLSGNLTVAFAMTARDEDVPLIEDATVTATLVSEATFTITPGTTTIDGNSVTASCTYTPSSGEASIWNRRNTALVLTAADSSSIPSDLSLTIYDGQATRNIMMNENSQFIIPLGAVASYSTLRITLNSDVFTTEDIVFDATWYVSYSRSGESSVNGYAAANAVWTFTNLNNPAPSLRIDDVDNVSHIYSSGSSVPVDVRFLNIPDGYRIYIQLYNEQTGTYTGWDRTITDFTNDYVRLVVPASNEGSYFIRAWVQRNSASGYINVLSEPDTYYFIVR